MRAAAIELQAQQLQPTPAPSLSTAGWGWGVGGEAEGEGGPLSPRGSGGGGSGADAFLWLLEALLNFVCRADAPGGGGTAGRGALLRELSALRLVMALLAERVPVSASATDAVALTPTQVAVATRSYALLAAACRRDAANARHAAQWLGRLVAHLPLGVGADIALAAIATSSHALRDGPRAAAHALVAALTPTSVAQARQPQALQRLRLLRQLCEANVVAAGGAASGADKGGEAAGEEAGEAAGEAAGAPLPWLQLRVCVALYAGPHRELLVKLRAAPLAERESWPHAASDAGGGGRGGGGGGGSGGGESERDSGKGGGAARRTLHGADDAELLERNAAR